MATCEVKLRLLAEYQSATEAYVTAVDELHEKIGTSTKPVYDRLLDATEQTRLLSDQAREAMLRHVREHGC